MRAVFMAEPLLALRVECYAGHLQYAGRFASRTCAPKRDGRDKPGHDDNPKSRRPAPVSAGPAYSTLQRRLEILARLAGCAAMVDRQDDHLGAEVDAAVEVA